MARRFSAVTKAKFRTMTARTVRQRGLEANSRPILFGLAIAAGNTAGLVASAVLLSPGGVAASAVGVASGLTLASIATGRVVSASAKGRAIENLINRARTGNTLGIKGLGRTASVSPAAGRLALARAAATRSAVAQRQTAVLGMRTGGRTRTASPEPAGDGSVQGYYRQQGGQQVFVQGYQRAG